ncbi:MAG: Glucose-6-phosphate isomerase [Candidatus Anoxychlamydiales bacterium]|nr:Glucose-6-phosphate isomerase [Candidatus Anoxychlamydiales bacterium]
MFAKLKSYEKLKNLAENPIDLTNKDIFTLDRIKKMQVTSPALTTPLIDLDGRNNANLKLLYATERISEDIIDALFELSKETNAISKMKDMQDGKIVNSLKKCVGENRAVLHTAMRDFFDKKNESKEAKLASDLAYEELEKLQNFLEKINKDNKFEIIVQIGIGGSFLGPKAIATALKKYTLKNRKFYFISNVDPDDSFQILESIDLSKTLFVSVSKSGTTLETLANEAIVKDFLSKKGLNPKDHMVSVTGKNSPMDDPTKYLESFYIWDYVGGRYSVSSMVGGVIIGFCFGIKIFKEFLKGASYMDKVALREGKDNLPLFSALLGIWNRNFLGYSNAAIIPYSQALLYFPMHLQQLDMESNGKSVNKNCEIISYKTGPIIFGDIGTNAQHSFFQLLHQGTDIVPIEFIGFKKSQYEKDLKVKKTLSQEKLLSNMVAQSIALAKGQKNENPNKNFSGNRPNHILLANQLDPFTLGALLSYCEHKIAFQGFVWDINSFDQEGVQLGKVLANKVLDLFAKKEVDFDIGKEYLKLLK